MARPTLYDVARHADVSLATASRVVNGSERGVGEALRERVLRSAAELGYVANGPAQALARASTPTVGVIVHDIADPYFTEIALGAMGVADDGKRLVTVCNTFGDPERERRYVALLNAQRVGRSCWPARATTTRGWTRGWAPSWPSYAAGGGRFAMVGRHAIEGDSVEPDNRAGAERLRPRAGRSGAPADRDRHRPAGPHHHRGPHARACGSRVGALDEDRIVAGDFGREGGARGAACCSTATTT